MSDAIIENWVRIRKWSNLRTKSVDERIKLHAETFADWKADDVGPAPIWFPSVDDIEDSNHIRLMREAGSPDLESFTKWWQTSPGEFWAKAIDALEIKFRETPRATVEYEDPRDPNWLPGASLNIVESCFNAPADAVAIRHGGANGEIRSVSYGELLAEVQAFANQLRADGFEPGDRIAIVMPMDYRSVVSYLGVLYAGCAAVSIADSFAPVEIEKRLRISEATGVLYCDEFQRTGKTIHLGLNVLEAVRACEKDQMRIRSYPAEQSGKLPDPVEDAFIFDDSHVSSPDHIVNILFSSGTTGDPKAIPWDQTTPIKCATDGLLHHNIKPGDVVVWPTNLGWMMGPWLIFATLMNRATIGLFEDAPTGESFGKFVQDSKTTMLGVVPALVRHWKNTQCMEGFDWSSIKCFSSTGEASNETDMIYLSALAGFKPIIEYCGGTEIGGGYVSSTMLQANVPAAFSTVAAGNHFLILDEDGKETDEGELFLVPPSIGLSRKLLNRDHFETYYADVPDHELALRRHGDRLQTLPGGYYRACGRMDDTMNPGGIKVGSAEIETIINGVEGIDESAVIAVSDQGTGPDKIVAFLVSSVDFDSAEKIKEINIAIRKQLNPLIRVSKIRTVENLPRTASNKIMRRELRKLESEHEG